MRTTVNLDQEVVEVARSMAATQKISLGEALSILPRRGIQAGTDYLPAESAGNNRFPTFRVSETTPPFGTDEEKSALEDE